MDKIPAAIIGLGRIASLLEEDKRREKPCTHAGAITANPDCKLVGGCDTDEERRRLFSERWNVPVYSGAVMMIRAQSPLILVIATHPDSHYHYCRIAASSGVPVIICEKPLADTVSKARKIVDLGVNSQTIITNHERRYAQDYIEARKILDGGELGILLSVKATLYMGKGKRLLDVFWHDGTHMADVIMFLTGMVLKHRRRLGVKLNKSIGTVWLEGELGRLRSAAGAKREQHDPVTVPVIIEIGAGRDHLVFEMEFSCAKGKLRIGNNVFEVWKSDESPYAEKYRSLKRTVESFNTLTGYFSNMIADAVSCLKEPGRQPVSSAKDGLKAVEYLHSVKAWR